MNSSFDASNVKNADASLTRRHFLTSVAATSILPAISAPSFAQLASKYPEKPIKMVHAFAAGSGTDVCGRLIADGLSREFGQAVYVENRPGASMGIGTAYAAKQPNDGYTLLMVTLDSLGINPYIYPHIGYSLDHFDPITMVGQFPLVMLGPPDSKYQNFDALLRASTTQNQEFSMGTWGYGSVGHMAAIMIAQKTALKFNYVPFQGAAPSTQAAMGGHVDLTLAAPQQAVEFATAGRVKVYAVGGQTRLPELPDVPTFKELGFSDLQAMQWHGVAARAGGNPEIVQKLYAGCQSVFRDKSLAQKILHVGYTKIDARPPAAFAQFIREENQAWGKLVKATLAPITK